MHTRYNFLLVVLATVLAGRADAQACTTSWAAPVDGAWSDASKWTFGVPGPTATACIAVPGTYTVTLDQQQDLGRLEVGGDAGVQTLILNKRLLTLGSGLVRSTGRLNSVATNALVTVTDTLSVEGVVRATRGSNVLAFGGVLDVAPGGTLWLDPSGQGVAVGSARPASPSTIRIRGRLLIDAAEETFQNTSLNGTFDIDGGTVEHVDGRLSVAGAGTWRDATFDVRPEAVVWISGGSGTSGVFTIGGTLSGTVEGQMILYTSFEAAPAGATLDIGGAGLATGGNVFHFTSAGGEFLNRGLLMLGRARGVTIRNEGTVRVVSGSANLSEGAVLRNEAGGTLELVDGGAFGRDDNTGLVSNAGLVVVRMETRPPFSATSQVLCPLAAEPGAEFRLMTGARVQFNAQDAAALGVAGVRVTGNGEVRFNSTAAEIGGTLSPGTDEVPIDTLRVRFGTLRWSRTSGQPQLVADIGANGVSDRVEVANVPVQLGGTVVLRLQPGYVPRAGDTFTLLQSGPDRVDGGLTGIETENPVNGITFVPRLTIDRSGLIVRAVATVDIADDAPVMMTLNSRSNPSRQPGLRLGLPDPRPTTVEVFDIRGRRVATVWDGPLASGQHDLDLPGGLPSGTYLVRVMADGEPRTISITVLR